MSAKVAYIDPIRNRKNLNILTESFVTKIIFENKKAIGIEILRKGKNEKYFCNDEIILSGGAINSPQILELSGVGRPEILKRNNIEIVHELQGVGENLMDHLGPRLVYKVKKPGLSYNEKARGLGLIKQALNYAFKNRFDIKRNAKSLMHVNKEKFSLKKMSTKLNEIIKPHLDKIPTQVDIKLPKLKKIKKPEIKNQ